MQRNWISIFGTDLRMITDNLISVWSVWVLIFSWSTQISNISIFKYCWNECQFWVESRALKKDNYLSFYFSWLKSITGFHHAFHCLRYHSSDLVLFLCKKSSEWSSSSGGICRFFFFLYWFLLGIVLNSEDLWNVLNSTAKMYNKQTLGAESYMWIFC